MRGHAYQAVERVIVVELDRAYKISKLLTAIYTLWACEREQW